MAEIFAKKTEKASVMLKPYLAHLTIATRAWVAILR
jgi:hypothetical protein